MARKHIFLFLSLLFASLAGFSQEKYAIGMFHFNLQYVAGDYKIENRIIRESLYPALQFFEKNKKYKADFEIQGYGIEVLAEEHPNVFKLFKKLVNRGQIELVIAHYSDQLFIGYPALDLQKSIEISDKILDKYGLKRSRVFFGQEIQWTPAYPSVLKGKYDLVVTSSDPHGWYRDKIDPLVNITYGDDQILGLIDSKKELNGLSWTHSFLDDGEVFNSLDYRSNFYRVPEQEKKNIERFRKLEKEGYKFVTMSELAEKIKNLKGYEIPDYPFVPEGTWNMSVCGPYMWMGRQRSGVETDGITRALSYDLRGKLLMYERLVEYAEKQGNNVSQLDSLIERSWRHLLLSEVSDASGWTPWLVEVQYTANEVANAKKELKEVEKRLLKILPFGDKTWKVDTKSGSVETVSSEKAQEAKESFFPIPVYVRAAVTTTSVKQINENLYRIDINCQRPADGAVEIVFDTPPQGLYYSSGAGEHISVEIPNNLKNDPAMALSNGFIYLNNGYGLVKDCTVEHLAATWKVSEQKLVFRQELAETNPEMNMRFYLVKGDKTEGLNFANALNTWPSYAVKIEYNKLQYKQIIP
nr:hypothetical protein [uncultured Draconibacterium sp.]